MKSFLSKPTRCAVRLGGVWVARQPAAPRRTEPAGLAEETRAFAADMGRQWQPIRAMEPEIALARGFITPLEFEQLPKTEPVVREIASGLKVAA